MVRAKYIHARARGISRTLRAKAEYRNFARARVYFTDPTNRPRHSRPLYSCLLDELVFAWQWQEVKSNELLGTFSRKQVTSLVAAGRRMNLSYPCMFCLMVSGKVFKNAPRSSGTIHESWKWQFKNIQYPPIVSYKRDRSLRLVRAKLSKRLLLSPTSQIATRHSSQLLLQFALAAVNRFLCINIIAVIHTT